MRSPPIATAPFTLHPSLHPAITATCTYLYPDVMPCSVQCRCNTMRISYYGVGCCMAVITSYQPYYYSAAGFVLTPQLASREDFLLTMAAIPLKKEGIPFQWRLFKVNPSRAKCPGSGTEIIPGKHSDTRIKPLPLTNGHGRYCT